MNAWTALERRISKDIERRKHFVGGSQNYGGYVALLEVLDWIREAKAGTLEVEDAFRTREDRVVHGEGTTDKGVKYEVVRYAKAKQYWVEYEDGARKKINVKEGILMTHTPHLGREGGTSFDNLWKKKFGVSS